MDDLDALLELGPRFFYRFLTEVEHQQLNIGISVRPAFSTNFSNRLKYEGYVFEPELLYWNYIPLTESFLFGALNLTFGTAGVNRFFYSVDPQFANANRPEFTANSGLTEISLFLGASQRINQRFSLFLAFLYSNLSLSANNESPLIEQKHNYGGIFGIIWNAFESKETVPALPSD